MRPDEQQDRGSTSWAEIDALVDDGGYRAGFVKVFLEVKDMVLEDEPLDGRGQPARVTQSNFAKHFGIAVSSFNRWLGEHGGEEYEHLSPGGTEAAKERRDARQKKKNAAAAAQDVRRMVAGDPQAFADKLAVHKVDQDMWWLDCQILVDSDMPLAQKKRTAEIWLEELEAERRAVEDAMGKLLEFLTGEEAAA